VEEGQIKVKEKTQLQNIKRKRRGKVIVIFAHPSESIFQIAIADSFIV